MYWWANDLSMGGQMTTRTEAAQIVRQSIMAQMKKELAQGAAKQTSQLSFAANYH